MRAQCYLAVLLQQSGPRNASESSHRLSCLIPPNAFRGAPLTTISRMSESGKPMRRQTARNDCFYYSFAKSLVSYLYAILLCLSLSIFLRHICTIPLRAQSEQRSPTQVNFSHKLDWILVHKNVFICFIMFGDLCSQSGNTKTKTLRLCGDNLRQISLNSNRGTLKIEGIQHQTIGELF